jgi:3',5'-nucleoside bisphosphate phosphatase
VTGTAAQSGMGAGGPVAGHGPVDGLVDLHTHSSCSDGVLEPAALVELAAARGVRTLALTDHDTVAGLPSAASACRARGVHFVPGVELSCDWRGQEIHVVALNVDAEDAVLLAHCAELGQRRRTRMRQMGEQLSALGLPGEALTSAALRAAVATRTHLARSLVMTGFARSPQDAFERYLQHGRPGYAEIAWPELRQTVECIGGAGGVAVLAHPHRYGLSTSQLAALLTEFKALGGTGLEVSLAGMGPTDSARALALAQRFGLTGSVGSDFHEPGLPWRPLGRFAKLPPAIRPITTNLGL